MGFHGSQNLQRLSCPHTYAQSTNRGTEDLRCNGFHHPGRQAPQPRVRKPISKKGHCQAPTFSFLLPFCTRASSISGLFRLLLTSCIVAGVALRQSALYALLSLWKSCQGHMTYIQERGESVTKHHCELRVFVDIRYKQAQGIRRVRNVKTDKRETDRTSAGRDSPQTEQLMQDRK